MPASIQLHDIFDALGDGLFVASKQGRYIEVNPAGCRMFGYSREEFLELSLADMLDASELDRLPQTVADMADLEVHRGEWLFQRKDGSRFLGELVGGQLPDGTLQSVVRDVTERREREDLEHTLRRESAHRSKNTLAVVQAIMRQSHAADPQGFAEKFEDRIRALAAAHGLFAQNDWTEVGLAALVRSQMRPFAVDGDGRIAITGPDVRLSPPAAQAIGMALHELRTNAAKYGALSIPAGRVEIGWRIDAAGNEPSFALQWRERRGPAISPPTRTGFGTTMIVKMTQQALRGRSDVSYDRQGLCWKIECPVSALTAG